MNFFKRLFLFLFCFVSLGVCVSPVLEQSASASSGLLNNYSVATTLWDMVSFSDCVGFTDYLSAITSKTDDGCTVSEDGYHLWRCTDTTVGLFTNLFPIYCAYCNENYASYIDKESLDSSDIEDIYQDYVSTLDSTIVSNSSGSKYAVSFYNGATFSYVLSYSSVLNFSSVSTLLQYTAITSAPSLSSFLVDVSGTYSAYSIVSSAFSCAAYSFSVPSSGYYCFNLPSVTSCSSGCSFSGYYYLLSESESVRLYPSSGDSYYLNDDCSYFLIISSFILPQLVNSCSYYFYYDSEPYYYPVFGLSSYFNTVNNYNTTNNYTDNSEVVNYYIGTTDDTGDVTNIYNVSLYDESSLIFTEPVTETQYQTTGWTYDYTTRTYTLDLDSGTFYIGDYDIDTIDLTYGDDALTITYYADGVAITTDEYVYVMVSQSECALNGHTYSLEDYQAPTCCEAGYYDYVCSVCGNEYLETIDATGEHSYEYSIYQDPTCTSEGIGLYTCSVCGNQYTEPISATGHSYGYSIYQEATCTTDGIGLYTCSECGDQYTEVISATGHDWLATSVTETTYSFPDDKCCPDCGSDLFNYELDTDAATYTATCEECGTTWTVDADVTYGGTTYTCSICGETYFASDDPNDSDSLFGAIANFISSGISWIIEKFNSLIESISGLIDTFNEYVATLSSTSSSFPAFLAGVVSAIPDELTVILWFAVITFVVAAVWKKFFM